MDLGIPTLVEMKSVEDAAAFASLLGFSFVELNMNLPWCTIENLQKTDFRTLTSRYNIYFTIHADENLFFCDFSERVAKAHTQNMLDAIELASKNGIQMDKAELEVKAEAFALNRGSRSARCAEQFIKSLM